MAAVSKYGILWQVVAGGDRVWLGVAECGILLQGVESC